MWSVDSDEKWFNGLDALAADDIMVLDNVLPSEVLESIQAYFNEVESQGELVAAGIGSFAQRKRIKEIRSDMVYWLERDRDIELAPFFEGIDQVRKLISREFFLTLLGYEFHFAKYPPGAFYKPHLDQFVLRDNRILSVVIYLNRDWRDGDGGELVIHKPSFQKIQPILNRAVVFRSDTVLHEVLPANKSRRSLTGWLLKRPSTIGVLGL